MSLRNGISARVICAMALSLMIASPVALLADLAPNAAAYSDISMELDYPRYAGKGEAAPCTLTVAGGPADDIGGNFSYRAEIVGDDTTGGSVNPSTGTSESKVFKFNVTMPTVAPQTIKLKINVTSKAASGGDSRYKVREFEIKVVDPIVIKATVYNIGDVDAEGVSAKIYADGLLLATKTFDVEAGGSKSIQHNWTFVKIDQGKHTVTIVVDHPSGIVEFSDGNNVYTLTIYVGDQNNPLGAVLTGAVMVMAVLVALMFLQKPSRRRS